MAQRTHEEPVRPVHTVRYGAIKAAVWKNPTKNGAMYNVTVSRSYRIDDQWHDSNSFGYDDLLIVGKALDDAHTWIHQAMASDAETAHDSRHTTDEDHNVVQGMASTPTSEGSATAAPRTGQGGKRR